MIINLVLAAQVLVSAGTPSANVFKELIQEKSIRKNPVQWDSREHRHLYFSNDLKERVRKVADQIELDPRKSRSHFESLSLEDQARLTTDRTDSRTELFDLISLELKQRLKKKMLTAYPGLPLDNGQLWSLTKHQLRKLFMIESADSHPFALFRVPGLRAQEAVWICADMRLEFQKIQLNYLNAESLSCAGKKFSLRLKKEKSSWTSYSPPQKLFLPKEEDLHVLVTLGLSDSVKKSLVDSASLFLEYWRGYSFVSREDVDLREALLRAHPQADMALHLLDIPNRGDRFGFFSQATRGQRLKFERRIRASGVRSKSIHLEILLPPLRGAADARNLGEGVHLRASEMDDLFRSRSKALLLLDITCFSKLQLKDWIPRILAANRNDIVAIGSNRGHQGETLSDLVPLMDLLLNAIQDVSRQKTYEKVLERLHRGPQLAGMLINTYRVLNNLPTVDFSFLPVSTLDSAVLPWLHDPEKSIFELRSDKKVFRFEPVLF